MSRQRAELTYLAALTTATLGAHALWTSLPFIFVFPALLAYTVRQPFWYLVLTGSVAELFSAHTPGIVLAVVLMPLAVRRALAGVPIDLTLTFSALVAGTLAMQFGVLFAPDMWLSAVQAGSFTAGLGALLVVPWHLLGRLIISAVPIFIVSVLVHFNRTW
ncbi:MAG: hypothetical protein HY372_02930 [Candidatus Andersenbacteria bacterium]|nr:hypothetical protein [Candidatus Andersenbacteria bacterium]